MRGRIGIFSVLLVCFLHEQAVSVLLNAEREKSLISEFYLRTDHTLSP
jgi:hypothetical protein